MRNILEGIAKVREAHPITLDNSEPEPDIAIVRFNNNNYSDRHPDAGDIYWLAEVSNRTLTKDLEDKSVTYSRNGIPIRESDNPSYWRGKLYLRH